MPAVTIDVEDLVPFAAIESDKAEAMIEHALAQAWLAAPCIVDVDLDERKAAAAKAIILDAIVRWNEAGTGAVSQQVAGPFQQTLDTRQSRRSKFWPSEIQDLQKLCRSDSDDTGAWSYDTAGCGSMHADVCALNLGANYCSCGAIYAGFPLWENSQ